MGKKDGSLFRERSHEMTMMNSSEVEPLGTNDDIDDGKIEGLYPDGGWRAYSVVLGSFFCCFTCFGIMNSVGAIESYIVANQLSNVSVSTVSWIFSLFMFLSLFLGLLVGPLYDIVGSQWLLLIGSLLMFVGVFTTGSCTKVYQFVLAFGVCTGIGDAFMMFPSVSCISSWFSKNKRSFMMGVGMSGGSVGGVAFPILLRYLFPKYGFTWSLRILALFNLGTTFIGTALTHDRLRIIRMRTCDVDNRTLTERFKDSIDIKAFKEKSFTVLACAVFMNEFSLLIALTYVASYAIVNGISQRESFNILTVLNAAGILGRFGPSYLADIYGTFNMIILMSALMTVSMFVIWLPFGQYRVALYVFVVLFGFGCAATYALTGGTVSTITKHTKDFGKRYGTIYAFVSFGNLISLPISGALIKEKNSADYQKMVIFASCTCGMATILFIAARYTIVGKKIRTII